MEPFPNRRHLRPASSVKYQSQNAGGTTASPRFMQNSISDYSLSGSNNISSANSSTSSSPSTSSTFLTHGANSVGGRVAGGGAIGLTMPVNTASSVSGINSFPRSKGGMSAGVTGRFRNPFQDSHYGNNASANVADLREKINEMNSMRGPAGSLRMSNVESSSGAKFNRSVSSSSGLRMPPVNHLQRHGTSPAIVELPSHSPTDSLDESVGCGMHAGYPIVTSPATDLVELASQSSDPESSGLTSPNLVTSTGLQMTNSLPINVGLSRLQHAGTVGTVSSTSPTSLAMPGASPSLYSREERKTSTSSKTQIVGSDGQSSEKTTTTGSQMMHLKAGDLSIAENRAASASRARVETAGGTVAEHTSGIKQRSRSVVAGNMAQHERNLASLAGTTVKRGGFVSQNLSEEQSSSSLLSSVSPGGRITHQQSSHHASKKISVTRAPSLLTMRQIHEMMSAQASMSIEEIKTGLEHLEDLESLTPTTNVHCVQNALVKCCNLMNNSVAAMRKDGNEGNADSAAEWISKINDMVTKSWEVPSFGHEMGNTLCDMMCNNGGLDILMENCASDHQELQYQSAKLLQQCLMTENRGYVVEKGLEKVVEVAKNYTVDIRDVKRSRVGTGILEHLFKHSESTCSDVIALGGLENVVNECKSTDEETLRHCAGALANVAMYGGSENQEAMINMKVPSWLFPLAFHNDDTVKYYACLAIAALVANKEIEATVQKSKALELIEPFVQSHTPSEFAHRTATHSHGQSPNWLKRLIPVLMSHREEARNLAAFHFCMEAEIKKILKDKTDLFSEIGAVESLKKLASSPNGIASKYAAQTLRLIGEEVPHKLSQQVPTWSVEDVRAWVKQIGFAKFADSFAESRVDGDLLLQLTEEMLREDINMRNGILRRRFLRELTNLKRVADYSACDPSNLNDFLQNLGQEYSVYTYDMINAGIDRDTLMNINDEQLLSECGIANKIHRLKIQQGVKMERGDFSIVEDNKCEKTLDVFISYRRSNGSQLASLLKVHLEIRNFSVFLDVAGLESGKFDYNLLQSIRSARNFVLVLTPHALDRCFDDDEQRDWIHKEVACALQSNCNIIPVFDNFVMPDIKQLPDSMKAVTSYNGVKWIHDYQDACVDKIDRFIRGEAFNMMDRFLNSQPSTGSAYGSVSGTYNRQNTYVRNTSQDNSSACSDDANQNSSSSAKDI